MLTRTIEPNNPDLLRLVRQHFRTEVHTAQGWKPWPDDDPAQPIALAINALLDLAHETGLVIRRVEGGIEYERVAEVTACERAVDEFEHAFDEDAPFDPDDCPNRGICLLVVGDTCHGECDPSRV